jgi:predicted nucleic-acid-binding Zn-ribbon protein
METKQQWVCTKCGGREADTGVIRTTGGGASRYFNIQNQKFEYLSCKRCGYTDLFRPSDQGGGWRTVLDVLTN